MNKESQSEELGPEVRPASNEVQELLDRLAKALTSGEGRAVAALWAVPAMVLGDDDTKVIGSPDEIATFFGSAKEHYNARGIVETHADILRLTWMTERVAMVDVRWPYLDVDGHEHGYEMSTYTLRRDDNGELKIQVVVMRGASQSH